MEILGTQPKRKMGFFFIFCFLLPFFFRLGKISLAEEKHLLINEIQISGGTGKTENDFVEIYNPSDSAVNLKGYRLVKRSKNGTTDTSIKSWAGDTIIASKGYHLWANSNDGFANSLKADSATTQTISADNGIALRHGAEDSGEIIDSVGWGDCQNIFVETFAFGENPPANKSLARTDFIDSDNNSKDFSLQNSPSPTNSTGENSKNEEEGVPDEDEKNSYKGKIKINEILPAPKTQNNGKEFVEIINLSNETISLSGMFIEDEKNHKVLFPNASIRPQDFFVLEGDFELNNTSPDTAYLIAQNDTKENPLDLLSYTKPKYDYAYAFDGAAWQWTSKITKGAENEFDEQLSGKIKKDKKIYAGVYANFEVHTDKKAKKITWNFGDGHKSYIKKTRHKYEKAGTYEATLKITGDGKDTLLNFAVKVEKFKKTKVQITALSANPSGQDSDNEWIELFNGTKKKIDLKNWSVATGWKTLANHPVRESFVLRSGETKKLTRKICAFTLGNKRAKIELRSPDGKVSDKLKYDRKNKSISENELYQKEGDAWQWVLSQKDAEEKKIHSKLETDKNPEITLPNISPEIKNEDQKGIGPALSDLGKYSEDPAWQKKQKMQLILLFAKSNIEPEKFVKKNQSRVLGISTLKINPPKALDEKLPDQFWKKINARLNKLILLF